jgi:hypothetical protein
MSTGCLPVLTDGCVSYRLRLRWRNRVMHVLSEPQDLIAKLEVLVPPPL